MSLFFLLLLLYIVFTDSCLASLVNFTIDDTFGDQRTGVQPIFDSSWLTQSQCNRAPQELACNLSVNTTAAFNETWHATVNNATLTFSFNGSAIYLYFIPATLPSSGSKSKQVASLISIFLDGVKVHEVNRIDLNEVIPHDIPAYVNSTLPAGVHGVTIQSHAMSNDIADSVVTAAIFDYAIYSYEDGTRTDLTVRFAIISVVSGVMFLGICSCVGLLLRSRAHRKTLSSRIDPWVSNSPPTIRASSQAAGCSLCLEVDINKVEKQKYPDSAGSKSNMAQCNFGSPSSRQATAQQTTRRPSIRFGPLDKTDKVKEQYPCLRPSVPQILDVDVFLMQRSLAANNGANGIWRRRSTLSRLGVRLGEGASPDDEATDPLLALHERNASHATGASRLRSQTDARPTMEADAGEDHTLSALSLRQADAELIAQLQTEVHMLRAERNRRVSIPGEDPPSYEELNESKNDGSDSGLPHQI